MKEKPQGAGGSSFKLIDVKKVLKELHLKKGSTILDMACGHGKYAIEFSKIVGEEGLIYAVDLREEYIVRLKRTLSAREIKNIKAMVANVSKPMLIERESIDVCFMAMVLHDLVLEGVADGAITEVARVLKRNGMLVIIEFKKIEGPPGPPVKIKLSSNEVESIVVPHGFSMMGMKEVGDYNYLITFNLKDAP